MRGQYGDVSRRCTLVNKIAGLNGCLSPKSGNSWVLINPHMCHWLVNHGKEADPAPLRLRQADVKIWKTLDIKTLENL